MRNIQFDNRRSELAKIAREACQSGLHLPPQDNEFEPCFLPYILHKVFNYLSLFDLAQVMQVSKAWSSAAISDEIWHGFALATFPAAEKVQKTMPDNRWIDIFKTLSLTREKNVGPCAVCGQPESHPFEPEMKYLCYKCPRPFRGEQMTPLSKLLNKGSKVSPEDVLQYTRLGPFRTSIDKFVGFNAVARITVPAYPTCVIQKVQIMKQEEEEKAKAKKKGKLLLGSRSKREKRR